jgi:hypothetical protein
VVGNTDQNRVYRRLDKTKEFKTSYCFFRGKNRESGKSLGEEERGRKREKGSSIYVPEACTQASSGVALSVNCCSLLSKLF